MNYDNAFFDHIDRGSFRSAEIVVRELVPHLQPLSLLDVGCGRGCWAQVWKRNGCPGITGIDGAYVDGTMLHIDEAEFLAKDLSFPFDLGRRFDLVQCLEVAEHLPERAADGLIDSIVRHGDVVLFSAAVPGQGGTHHVNEQPVEYWRDKFAARGYAAFDVLRPRIWQNPSVAPWFRFNSLIYANETGQARLSVAARQAAVESGQNVREYGSWSWLMRKAIIRRLPLPVVSQVARANGMLTRMRA